MIVTPGPVVNFLLTNQNVRDVRDIDWPKVHDIIALPDIPAFIFLLNIYFLCLFFSSHDAYF